MRAKLANENHCAVPFFRLRQRQLVLALQFISCSCIRYIVGHMTKGHVCSTIKIKWDFNDPCTKI